MMDLWVLPVLQSTGRIDIRFQGYESTVEDFPL